MLEMRPNCECCDCDLPPSSDDARICTFDCTFRGVCPNCGGNLVIRPIRPAHLLAEAPASTTRVLKAESCARDVA